MLLLLLRRRRLRLRLRLRLLLLLLGRSNKQTRRIDEDCAYNGCYRIPEDCVALS